MAKLVYGLVDAKSLITGLVMMAFPACMADGWEF